MFIVSTIQFKTATTSKNQKMSLIYNFFRFLIVILIQEKIKIS